MIAVIPLCGEWEGELSALVSAKPSMILALSSGKCRDYMDRLKKLKEVLRCKVKIIDVSADKVEDVIPKVAEKIQKNWDGSVVLLVPGIDVEHLAALLSMAFLPRYMREACTLLLREKLFKLSKLLEKLRPRLSATEKRILEVLESMGGCSRAKDLANTLGISRSSLYRSISRLLELGFVKRESRGLYCLERER